MFKGMVIDELMGMVARAEDQAHTARFTAEVNSVTASLAHDELLFDFACSATDSQPTMIGVA